MIPLPQRLINDLRVRNDTAETIKSYVWGAAKLEDCLQTLSGAESAGKP
jgi:hypothetical protein